MTMVGQLILFLGKIKYLLIYFINKIDIFFINNECNDAIIAYAHRNISFNSDRKFSELQFLKSEGISKLLSFILRIETALTTRCCF